MLRVALDENSNMDIVRGVLRVLPAAPFVWALSAGLERTTDPQVLAWAANEGRVLLPHDVSTMTRYAYDRVCDGLPIPGVFEFGRHVPLSRAIEDIVLIITCSAPGEWEGQVRYLPL